MAKRRYVVRRSDDRDVDGSKGWSWDVVDVLLNRVVENCDTRRQAQKRAHERACEGFRVVSVHVNK